MIDDPHRALLGAVTLDTLVLPHAAAAQAQAIASTRRKLRLTIRSAREIRTRCVVPALTRTFNAVPLALGVGRLGAGLGAWGSGVWALGVGT